MNRQTKFSWLLTIAFGLSLPVSGMEQDLSEAQPTFWPEDIAIIEEELARRDAEVPPRDHVFRRSHYHQENPPQLARYQLCGLAILGASVFAGFYLFNLVTHFRSFHKA